MGDRIFVSVPAQIVTDEGYTPPPVDSPDYEIVSGQTLEDELVGARAVREDTQALLDEISRHADEVSQVSDQVDPVERHMGHAQTRVGFTPWDDYAIVVADSIERSSESGLDLSLAESLDSNFPLSGVVVAVGSSARYFYQVGDHIMFRRYAGIQATFNGNPNHWILTPARGEILGRFDTTPQGTPE